MFLIIIVKDMIIHIVLNTINVGSDFFILAHINNDEVIKVMKCNHHISTPNINPGMMIAAFAIQAESSITL
jgi:hypothetical protein